MDVSIIIVTFNGRDITPTSLEAFRQTVKNDPSHTYEIVVSDNGSTDGVCEVIEADFPEVKLLRNNANLGFSKANNIAFRQSSGRYLLFSNADITVTPEVIPYLVKYMDQNPSVGICSPLVKLVKTGDIDWVSHRGFPTPWAAFTFFSGLENLFKGSKFLSRIFGRYHLRHENLTTVHEVDSVTGAFLFIRREVFEKASMWDERYFLYGEDIDLCYQVKKLGYKVVFNPEVSVLHYHGLVTGIKKSTSEITKADPQTKNRAYDAFYEAMKLFYDKNYKDSYPKLLRSIVFKAIDIKRMMGLKGRKV